MAERDRDTAALVAGAGAGSVLTYLLTARKAQAAPAGVDQELWDMLLALVEALALQGQQLEALTNSVDTLIRTMGATAPEIGEDPFRNTPKFTTGQFICPAALIGYHLPPIIIPKNKQLVVKALPGNIMWIWVGYRQADAQNMGVAYPLVPNEGVGLFIEDAKNVWVMAQAVNDGVAFVVEQA